MSYLNLEEGGQFKLPHFIYTIYRLQLHRIYHSNFVVDFPLYRGDVPCVGGGAYESLLRLRMPLLYPLVLRDPVQVQSERQVGLQQGTDQWLRRQRDLVPDLRPEHPVLGQLVAQQLRHVRVVEGHGGVQHHEHYYSQRPHVGQFRVVRRSLDDFGGGVGGRAAVRGAEQAPVVGVDAVAGEAEVGYFDVVLARQQHVLALEVAVGDVQAVQVLQPADHLFEPDFRLALGHGAVLLYVVQQVTLFSVSIWLLGD